MNEGTATGTWAQQLHWAPRETMRNPRVKLAPLPGWAALGGFMPPTSVWAAKAEPAPRHQREPPGWALPVTATGELGGGTGTRELLQV